jgi:hypothetical protein
VPHPFATTNEEDEAMVCDYSDQPPAAQATPAASPDDRWIAWSPGDRGDIGYGQIVIVAARWILVMAGLLLALWNPISLGALRVQLAVILVLAIANFALHAQFLMRRPTLAIVTYIASAADLALIGLLVLADSGLKSNLFVFYFPAMLAVSVTFAPRITAQFASAMLVSYALIGLASIGPLATVEANLQELLTRLLMLAAVAVCGAFYWRGERERRRPTMSSGAVSPRMPPRPLLRPGSPDLGPLGDHRRSDPCPLEFDDHRYPDCQFPGVWRSRRSTFLAWPPPARATGQSLPAPRRGATGCRDRHKSECWSGPGDLVSTAHCLSFTIRC